MDTTPANVVAPGAVVDGYLIEAVLGSGGVGTVCVAHQVDSGHRVALKVLNAAVSGEMPGSSDNTSGCH